MPNEIERKKAGMAYAKGGKINPFAKYKAAKGGAPAPASAGVADGPTPPGGMKKGGEVKKYAAGGLMRGTGAATRGKGFSGCK